MVKLYERVGSSGTTQSFWPCRATSSPPPYTSHTIIPALHTMIPAGHAPRQIQPTQVERYSGRTWAPPTAPAPRACHPTPNLPHTTKYPHPKFTQHKKHPHAKSTPHKKKSPRQIHPTQKEIPTPNSSHTTTHPHATFTPHNLNTMYPPFLVHI